MRVDLPLNPKSKTDLGKTLSKNSTDELVRPAQELAKSASETSSKVRAPKIYNKVIHDPIHGNR